MSSGLTSLSLLHTYADSSYGMPHDDIEEDRDLDVTIDHLAHVITSLPENAIYELRIPLKLRLLERVVTINSNIDHYFRYLDPETTAHLMENPNFHSLLLPYFTKFEETKDSLTLTNIEYLSETKIKKITSLINQEKRSLVQILNISNATFLKDLSFVNLFSNLNSLNCSWCINLTSLTDLQDVKKLHSLTLEDCKNLKTLAGIKGLPLETLILKGCIKLNNVSEIVECPIKSLNISECQSLRDFSFLEKLQLSHFEAENVPRLDPKKIENILIKTQEHHT